VLVGVYQFETNDIGASLFPLLPRGAPRAGHELVAASLGWIADAPRCPSPGLTELLKKAWRTEPKKAE